MQDDEILKKWKRGLSKEVLAKIYRREYNQQIKIVRSNVRHIHSGKFITNYESLAYVENVLYKYLKEKGKRDNKK